LLGFFFNSGESQANWSQHSHFAALDWASDHHDMCVLDRSGAIVAEFRFTHTAAGWAEFTQKMKPYEGEHPGVIYHAPSPRGWP